MFALFRSVVDDVGLFGVRALHRVAGAVGGAAHPVMALDQGADCVTTSETLGPRHVKQVGLSVQDGIGCPHQDLGIIAILREPDGHGDFQTFTFFRHRFNLRPARARRQAQTVLEPRWKRQDKTITMDLLCQPF